MKVEHSYVENVQSVVGDNEVDEDAAQYEKVDPCMGLLTTLMLCIGTYAAFKEMS